ncbi:MAG TPA: OPT/YSL family transporter [Phycisphaerae bacterium]|nr:OPT/YSL family transporter [Phycisphaerae bacterium]
MANAPHPTKFPENAYRELEPGETYVPMVPPDMAVPELTGRVIVFGLIMNIIFSVAATFLALKAGQGIETAIPISILAVGLSGFLLKTGGRGSSILENVYVLAISTTSGYVAGGTCFTMPAIYILSLNTSLEMSTTSLYLQIALVPFLGSILGVIFLIPFRRYFVKEMHGKLPFPEATATNEILVTGASGSTGQAWILIYSFILSAVYTFLATGLKLFSDVFTTGMTRLEVAGREPVETLAFGEEGLFGKLATGIKAVLSMGAGAYYLGLGFIIGLRYASIICAGSFLSCFALVPLLAQLDLKDLQRLNPACVAHNGPEEDTPRFGLPMGLAATLDRFGEPDRKQDWPEQLKTYDAELRDEFARNEIVLEPDATVSMKKAGEKWEVTGGKNVYTLKATESDIAVHFGTEKEPRFTIAASFGGKLDEMDRKAILRREIGEQFAQNEHPFAKQSVEIAVREAGHVWRLKDKYQAYVLRAEPDADTIAVFAQEAGPGDIFTNIPKNIGIGAIFTAGLLSILKMGSVIVTALRKALGSLFRKGGAAAALERTDEDISYPAMAVLGVVTIIVMAVFFRIVVLANMPDAGWLTFVSVILALVIAFLFTTVSAWAIAMISVTPISGMTVTTIIITAVVLAAAGLPKGDGGMLATLLVGGVVCCALSMAGGLVTNFKLGYWLGASPRKIAWCAIVGSLVSALFVGGTIMVLAYQPGYTGPSALPAPQANMMASALESFLGTGEVPWLLYGVGVVIALLVELIGISALAFGLGMYLPIYINTPILIGAFVATLVRGRSKDETLSKARSNKGILIASGLIAGGAIMEVLVNFTAALDDLFLGAKTWVGSGEEIVGKIMPALDMNGRMIDGGVNPESLARTENWLGLVLFLGLCVFVYFDCRRAKPDAEAPEIHM